VKGKFYLENVAFQNGEHLYQSTLSPTGNSLDAIIDLGLSAYVEGGDFFLVHMNAVESTEIITHYEGHQLFLISKDEISGENVDYLGFKNGLYWYESKASLEIVSQLEPREGLWLGVCYLPPYMSIKNYESQKR